MKEDNDETGKQDEFYFEPSKLTEGRGVQHALYSRLPVALLFGWAGAQDQNLLKYSRNIYGALGFHTIRIAPSFRLTFLARSKHLPMTYELLDLLRTTYALDANPLHIHMLSNACGFVLYQHLINEMNGTNGVVSSPANAFFKRNLRSVVFDSAPGWPGPLDGIGGLANMFESQVPLKPLRYALSTLAIGILTANHLIRSGDTYLSRMFETLKRDAHVAPTLAIYTTVDRLIPAHRIQNLLDERRRLFPHWPLKVVVYDDAAHVMIYQKHPAEYLEHVRAHLQECQLILPEMAMEQRRLVETESTDSSTKLKSKL